jgi:hypothetical protein
MLPGVRWLPRLPGPTGYGMAKRVVLHEYDLRKGRFAKLSKEIGSGEYAIKRIEEHAKKEICGVNRGKGDLLFDT